MQHVRLDIQADWLTRVERPLKESKLRRGRERPFQRKPHAHNVRQPQRAYRWRKVEGRLERRQGKLADLGMEKKMPDCRTLVQGA
jgi:hypothetical protein